MSSSPRSAAAVVIVGALVFLGLQFVRPALTNPPVTADLDAPAPVKAILQNACYACHSNETRLPWFDQVVPAYWLGVHDIRAGRERLNFSTIGAMPEAKRKALLWESVNQAMVGAMPLPRYALVHPGAKVTPEQLATLKAWLHPADAPAPAATPASAPLPPLPATVRPSPNGIAFLPDYKNWATLSTTDRFDNHTLRVIAGNGIAMKASAEGRTHPWPDGAAFAKIAFAPGPDGKASTFKQVEFMVKDAAKYRATEGWGFARWVYQAKDGEPSELAPYGKDRDFARECAGCHAPMQADDFVYTLPLAGAGSDPRRFNAEAALPDGLGLPPDLLSWQALASSVDEAAGTMTTLYANDPALAAGRAGQPYPAGAVLARVTWARRDDPHWFGARIPGAFQKAEVVTFSVGADGNLAPVYNAYSGGTKFSPPVDGILKSHIDALIAEKPSPLP